MGRLNLSVHEAPGDPQMPVLNSAGSIRLAVAALFVLLGTVGGKAQAISSSLAQSYQYEETRNLVALVDDATELVRTKGEAAFNDFRVSGSRWRQGETYIFVLDPEETCWSIPIRRWKARTNWT